MNVTDQALNEILIAEDDKDDFDILCDVIHNLGIKTSIHRAENGEILMKLIHEKIPDILFLDLIMPCKDGRSCILEIRGNKKFDQLPIIVYSSYRDPHTIESCYRAGSNMFVLKPSTYSEVVDVVKKIFAVDWKNYAYYPARSEYILNPPKE